MTPESPDDPAPVGVFIHGSCVSRDTFTWMAPDFVLTGYVARQSLISVNNDGSAELADEPRFDSVFQERMRRGDVLGNGLMALRRAAPNTHLILLDLCDERLGVYDLGQGRFVTKSVERAPRGDLPFPHTAFGTDTHFALWRDAFDWWLSRVRHIVPRVPVVVLAPPWAARTEEGDRTPPSYDLTAESGNEFFQRYYDHVRGRGLPVLGTDLDVHSSRTHKWGPAPFHYTDRVYEELVAEIRSVPVPVETPDPTTSTAEMEQPGPAEDRDSDDVRMERRPVALSTPPTRYASLRHLLDRDYEPLGTLEIEHHGLPLHVSFQPCDAPTTVVSFGGSSATQESVPAWTGKPPVSGSVVNLLRIADPSFILSRDLRAAWYAGNRHQPDLPEDLTELIRSLAGDTRLVLYGSGSAGFAALRQASSLPGSRAVVVNPHTDLARVPGDDLAAYLSICWGIDDSTDPGSWPIVSSVVDRWREPVPTEAVVVQDSRKQRSLLRHVRPLEEHSHPDNRLRTVLLPDPRTSPVPNSALVSAIMGHACGIESWGELVDAVGAHVAPDITVDPESPQPLSSKDSS